MNIASSILIALAAITALVALEARDLRGSLVAFGIGGIAVAAALLVMGGVEVGIGTLVAIAVLFAVLWWALRRTTIKDGVSVWRLSREYLLTVCGLAVFVGLLLAVVVPLFHVDIPVVSDVAEGISGVSIAREVLVLAVAGVAVWVLARAAGRRGQ